jgi:ankyrin repeat protein
MTPLHIASMKGFSDIAEILIKKGADTYATAKASDSIT